MIDGLKIFAADRKKENCDPFVDVNKML